MSVQRFFYVLTLVLMLATLKAEGRARKDSLLFERIFSYGESIDTTGIAGSSTHAYQRFFFSTDRRTPFLMAVPTMYAVAHGGARQFAGEFYDKLTFKALGEYSSKRLLQTNTIPHKRKTMPTLLEYLTPEIYNETVLDGYLLSPFHRKNRRFYRYRQIDMRNGLFKITFKPKVDNTQLLSGRATFDPATGRIISTDLYGEFDMLRFRLELTMGDEGVKSLLPVRCQLYGRFKFMGSKFSARYLCIYDLDNAIADSLENVQDQTLMDSVRPEPLPPEEEAVIGKYFERQAELAAERDSLKLTTPEKRHKNLAKTIFWDILGDHMLNRVKSKFGSNDQGYLRINPILNPLYFGYSNRKGVVYKFDIRAGYDFTPNRDITVRLKAGYSFRQKQIYAKVPLHFNYNKRRHAFFAIDLDYGHHTYNNEIAADMPEAILDSVAGLGWRLDYFRDTFVKIYNNYDISDNWSFNAGFTYHRRQALHPQAFRIAGIRDNYRSMAPRLEVQYRPMGWKGPAITFDYERGIKGFLNSNTEYERLEIDGSYIHYLPRLQSVSMRFGAGLYTFKGGKQYFLDFTNFRENNLIGGWEDYWSGEFELLRSSWYNTSRYYLRANGTYESPLLIISHLPWIGHYIEKERFYLGAVLAEELQPYVEFGIGVTTRVLTLGAFIGNKNGHFERIGGRIGFELFRRW